MFWFTSDSHYGHGLVAGLRGFERTEEGIRAHDETLIEAWNACVKPGDVVYHLGDFMLPQNEERARLILRRLNGVKHLVTGNHDRPPVMRAKEWASVVPYRYKRFGHGRHVVMAHYAQRTWESAHHGAFRLYGHSHGNLADGYGRSMDVGVDTRPDRAPWSLDEIIDRLEAREPLMVDHHVPTEELL